MTGNDAQNISMIAPCGMNCGVCIAHLRSKNMCLGCWGSNNSKPKHCIKCSIKNCELLQETDSKFCYECKKYPCTRLKSLDKRYRANYAMSMIENLNNITAMGLQHFVSLEKNRWLCPTCGGIICVHRASCIQCS